MVIEMLLNNDVKKKLCSNDFTLSKGNKCNYVHYWFFLKVKLYNGKLIECRNPSLGFATKVTTCEGASQEWSLGVTFHALGSVGVWENVREWTSILPSELPLWELES
jgi:hypothetical protein